MPALTIARVTLKDAAKFKDYASKAPQTMEAFGGEFLYRGKAGQNLTGGGFDHEFTVIYQFPSLERAQEWYASRAYQDLITLRDEAVDIEIMSYDLPG